MEQKLKEDAERVIFNFTSVYLTEVKNSLVMRGLSFSMPPKTFNYSNY